MTARRPLVSVGGFTKELPTADTLPLALIGVTSFSAGDLSPLFTTAEATATTTPALSFTRISQSQNLFYGSPNGSSGVPTFRGLEVDDLPTVDLLHGGHGQTTQIAAFDSLSPVTTRGDIIYGGLFGSNKRLAGNGTSAPKYLKSTGSAGVATDPVWTALDTGDLQSGTLPIARGGTNATSFTSGRVPYFNGTGLVDSADMKYGSAIFEVGASAGGGEIRSHQNSSNFYISLKTDTGANLSGIYRNNPGFTSGFPIAYSTATGDILIDAFFGSGNKVSLQLQGAEIAKFDSAGLTMASGKPVTVGAARFLGYTSVGSGPTTTQFPNDKDWGFHKDTIGGVIYLAWNLGGLIQSVQLT
jgi:hypothetical protein